MTDWEPEFAGQRPPFEPGNDLAMTHGARSERQIQPRAQAILDGLLADPELPEFLRDPSYSGVLVGLARAEAVISLLSEHLATVDMAEATRGALPVLEQLRRWTVTALSYRKALGLTPDSRAKITRDLSAAAASRHAAGLDDLAATGARLVEAARTSGALVAQVGDEPAGGEESISGGLDEPSTDHAEVSGS